MNSSEVAVDGEVEGIATCRVGRLDDAGDRDPGRPARERREKIPLHLGGGRQPVRSACSEDQVGVAPPADEDQKQGATDGFGQLDRAGRVVPVAVLDDAHAVSTVDQGDGDASLADEGVAGLEHATEGRPVDRGR